MKTSVLLFSVSSLGALVMLAAACGGGPKLDPRYPAQPEGCRVEIFADAPGVQTDNIGPVMSSCDESVSDQDCRRQLMDEACKLGANILWGVPDKPTKEGNKNLWFGRAAHSKTTAPAPTLK